MNAIFTQIICINKLIWDRCCCSTICVSCAFAFALCFFRVFYRMSMLLCFFSFLANKTKTNKVLGFSVWLIFFFSFLFWGSKIHFTRLLVLSQSSFGPPETEMMRIFMRIKTENCAYLMLILVSQWFRSLAKSMAQDNNENAKNDYLVWITCSFFF